MAFRIWYVLGLVAACGVLAGCFGAGKHTASGSLDLAALYGVDGSRRSDQTIQQLTGECLKKFGFDESVIPKSSPDEAVPGSLKWAQQRGLGVSLPPELRPTNASIRGSEAELERLFARTAECESSSARIVASAVAKVVAMLPIEIRDELQLIGLGQHPAILKADHDWVLCMAKSGQTYQGRSELVLSVSGRWATLDKSDTVAVSQFQDQEKKIAIADVECYGRSVASTETELLLGLDAKIQAEGSRLRDPYLDLHWSEPKT